MKDPSTPLVDARDTERLFEEFNALLPAYLPELAPLRPGVVEAILRVSSRYGAIIIDRLNQAPDKNKLAFFDLLGISLLPPLPARVPLVFEPLPLAQDTRIAQGTRAGVNEPGGNRPIVFETEQAIAMAAAKLTDVFSLWPDRDGYIDHSMDLAGKRSFTLFKNSDRIPHVLYLAHDILLAIKGTASVEIAFDLSSPGNEPLSLRWEHWDGQVWRSFQDPVQDGTGGLMRNGVVTLQAVCGDSKPTKVANIQNHWIRSTVDKPLSPLPGAAIAMAETIRLRTTILRPLKVFGGSWHGIDPDAGWSDASKLDFSKTFFPMGKTPTQETVFYFESEEIFSKAGAVVQIAITEATTPEQEADALAAQYQLDVNNARTQLIKATQEAGISVVYDGDALKDLMPTGAYPTDFIDALKAVAHATYNLTDPKQIKDLPALIETFKTKSAALPTPPLDIVWAPAPPPFFQVPDASATQTEIKNARKSIVNAIYAVENSLTELGKLGPVSAAAAGGSPPPKLPPPRLVWEFFDGTNWQTLIPPSTSDVNNLLASGVISFTVPAGLAPFEIEGEPKRVIRARLASGTYNELQMISWFDPDAGQSNYIPVLKPRPPALSGFILGYSYKSAWEYPQRCLTLNDFQLQHHTEDAQRPGGFFAPFYPTSDAAPTLYIGFDNPLPNDLVSLYFDIDETSDSEQKLVWEVWNGEKWSVMRVEDTTGGLRRPGMVSFISPEVVTRRSASIKSISGEQLLTDSRLDAAIFKTGDSVVVRKEKKSELARIRRIEDEAIYLNAPLSVDYSGGSIEAAGLPRFGVARDWVRARMKDTGDPAWSHVNGIFLNAVWARQFETVNDETIGSALGRLNQSVFFNRFPVLPGEHVEIRELQGAQAEVEYPILEKQLLDAGFSSNDIRTVTDPRTNKITEVWVRWSGRPHLYFSGPDDRHYVIERARGRIQFGDGQHGKLPPAANSNIRARIYRSGGGLKGNVAKGQIKQLMSGAPAQAVFNPAAAIGGADGETLEGVMWRGPQVTRHRGRALSAADYEALAREASPGVALARALPATSDNLRPAPGWVTIIVVPQSADPRPTPSYEFRKMIAEYITLRAPATVRAGRINVIQPFYKPVGVSAWVTPVDRAKAGPLKDLVLESLARFLHPLTGGPDGHGWPFGRSVWISDVAALLESIPGLDFVRRLQLLVDGVPIGDMVSVKPEQIVVAGPMSIEMIQGSN